VNDPIGDAEPDPRIAASPDLRSATIEVSSNKRLLLTVRFAPGTFSPDTTFVQFSLTFDKSAEGMAPADYRCGDFIVEIQAIGGVPGQATVSRLNVDNRYKVTAHVPVAFVKDGADLAIPLSVLASAFRRVIFRVVAAVRFDERSTTPILDSMPDSGAAVAVGSLQGRRTAR
jgi:hypothetical protein